VNAGDVLALLIDEGSWEAAAAVARWQIKNKKIAKPIRVMQLSATHRGRPEVVLALTLGMIKRAHLNADGSVGTRAHDYVCVNDDATILNTRDPAVCAGLAMWLIAN
jgi:hypothetical protein